MDALQVMITGICCNSYVEEAKFYLENADYNEAEALKEFNEDRLWAAQSAVAFKPSQKTAPVPGPEKPKKESRFKRLILCE